MPNFAMSPQEKYHAFLMDIRTVNKRFTKKRSSMLTLLKELEGQIDNYYKRSQPLRQFRNSAEVRQLCKNPNDRRLQKYEHCMRRLVECWGKAGSYRNSSPNSYSLINRAKYLLDMSKNFACTDAVTFQGNINTAVDKKKIIKRAQKKGVKTGIPMIPRGGLAELRAGKSYAWDADQLRSTHEKVYRAKAGECTSFGYSAAHILRTSPGGLSARIEVVTYRMQRDVRIKLGKNYLTYVDAQGQTQYRTRKDTVTHVFCLLNREGGTTEEMVGRNKMQRLPHFSTWGPDCIVVDTWLASLGWDSCYKPSLYPYKGFLKKLYLEMGSLA